LRFSCTRNVKHFFVLKAAYLQSEDWSFAAFLHNIFK